MDRSLYVHDYSDDELYDLLDVNNPTDRELEARIYQLMQTYANQPDWYQFFSDVFHRFFDPPQEGLENPSTNATATPAKDPPVNPVTQVTTIQQYAKGKLNPLLKETIRRIVSIDSQFRDKKLFPYSTAFTFNLSEPLKDVVSLKLYSIQLPFTWYTVSTGFGYNMFYLKATAPGINNGKYDYPITIPPGNYQAAQFETAINKAIAQQQNAHPDVLFGQTKVTYDTNRARLTTTVDLKYVVNEAYYQWTPVQNDHAIPALLGYTQSSYVPTAITTRATFVPPTLTHTVNASNNTFYVLVYQGPDRYNPQQDPDPTGPTTSYVYQRIPVTLTSNGSKITADTLVSDINAQLQANSVFHGSSKVTPHVQGNGHTVYQFNLRLARGAKNDVNVKTCVYFPPTTPPALQLFYALDTSYTNTCFSFSGPVQELSDIVSDLPSERTTYTFDAAPTITFTCIEPGYTFPPGGTVITVPDLVGNRVTLATYLDKVNGALSSYKNENHMNPYIDAQIMLDANNVPTFQIDIAQTLDNSNFMIDLTGSVLDVACKLPPNVTTSTGSTFGVGTYAVRDARTTSAADYSDPRVGHNAVTVRATGPYNLGREVTLYLDIPGSANVGVYPSIDSLVGAVNRAFQSNRNPHANTEKCLLSSSIVGSSGEVHLTMQMDVRAYLNETSYQMVLSEPSWSTYLEFASTPYMLQTQTNVNGGLVAVVAAQDAVYSNMLTLTNDNNTFSIDPLLYNNELGPVYTREGTYQIPITLTLPVNQTYTKEQIVDNINACLAKDPRTQGSSIDITGQHTVFRLTVNQVFTTKDYELVFYDSVGFTHCNFGLPINVTRQSTLGWTLGYRNDTVYPLTPEYQVTNTTSSETYYGDYTNQAYTYDVNTNIATLEADTCLTTNIYSYALLLLDDYTQNHLNDGLVTIMGPDESIPLPSYATRQSIMCNPQTKTLSIGGSTLSPITNNQMTTKQIYAANQLLASQTSKGITVPAGPSVQDIFALIPVKTQGMQPGQSYIEFGGTMQNQDRLYFGPVNIRRMSIQLLNDKGTLLDLNGANWSFSLLVEQMYTK